MTLRFISMSLSFVITSSTIFLSMTATAIAADFSAPIIDLPRAQQENSSIIIKAIVDDDVGIASVTLYYRSIGQMSKFTTEPLTPTKNLPRTYSVTLPAINFDQKGIEYYVEASDVAGNVTQEPFPNKPKQFVFQANSDTKPSSSTSAMTNFRSFKNGLGWGLNLSYGNFTVDDPDGNTGTVYAPSYNATISYAPNPRWRGWASLVYQTYTLPYSESEIGQDVTSTRIDFTVQRSIPIFKSLGWIGAGLGIEKISSTNRGTERNNTFLNKYDDRNDGDFGLIVDFGYNLGPLKQSMVGLNGKIYKSLGDGTSGIIFGVFVLFD